MKLEFITKQEADSIRRKMRKSRTMEEYEGYLRQLPEDQVGKIEISQKDGCKPQTVRCRLIRASKGIDMSIDTKRVGQTVLFWRA